MNPMIIWGVWDQSKAQDHSRIESQFMIVLFPINILGIPSGVNQILFGVLIIYSVISAFCPEDIFE
ncbi:TPA: hypothetical protein DIC40_00260 [Patescibacteria group bacterium]|nr:hypothetical protein [Candidatus Gracilibacteria bacterium]